MHHVNAPTINISIYIAGDPETAVDECAAFCMEVGFCVTVTPTKFVYTGGQEVGVIVGIINYPRFPIDCEALVQRAVTLGERLIHRLHQTSATVETPEETIWISRRDDIKGDA